MDYDFNPTASGYYDRLGLAETAMADAIDRAGKLAYQAYHPDFPGGSQTDFLRIKQAREVLSDEKTRNEYDEALACCERLNACTPKEATNLFEHWKRSGSRKSVSQFIRENTPESGKDDRKNTEKETETTELERKDRDLLKQSAIRNPIILRNRSNTPPETKINFWSKNGHNRLYINNFHPEKTLYLNLNRGELYDENNRRVSDITWSMPEQDVIRLEWASLSLEISLLGRKKQTIPERDEESESTNERTEESHPHSRPPVRPILWKIICSTVSVVVNILSLLLYILGICIAVLGYFALAITGLWILLNILTVILGTSLAMPWSEVFTLIGGSIFLIIFGSILMAVSGRVD